MKKIAIIIAGIILFCSKAGAQNVPSFADLSENLTPSVVNVSTTPNDAVDEISGFDGELKPSESLGSGFILDEQGYIVTNHHVIDKSKAIEVILSDNTKLNAQMVGFDRKTDLAVIKIDTQKPLKPIKFGDSEAIRVGEWVLAIGNPFGLGSSVTAGIVSAKSRDIEAGPYDNFIQTDASINQGSSGGPLFNMNGEVIGINTAIFSSNGSNMGVGFAVPTHIAKFVIDQIKATGVVKRGWVGVKIQPISQDVAKSLNIDPRFGALVSGLTEEGPAQKAGIKVGDVILRFDNRDVDNTKNFSRVIAEMPVGKKVLAEIWRKREPISLDVTVGEMPEVEAKIIKQTFEEVIDAPAPMVEVIENFLPDIGVRLTDITPSTMDKYQLDPSVKGMIVTDVESGSDAAAKGLKIGDVIVKIDNKDVLDFNDAKGYISDARRENNRPVLLFVQTPEVIHFVAVKLK